MAAVRSNIRKPQTVKMSRKPRLRVNRAHALCLIRKTEIGKGRCRGKRVVRVGGEGGNPPAYAASLLIRWRRRRDPLMAGVVMPHTRQIEGANANEDAERANENANRERQQGRAGM